ncbi:MAG: ATP-binding protein [Pirellulales bacterium]
MMHDEFAGNDCRHTNEPTPDNEPLSANADLETVLAAWHTATVRLERTHESLRGEVQRLTDELEVKNRELARKNRLADLGQIAAHVAHEVRNGLVPVTLYMSLLRRHVDGNTAALSVVNKLETSFGAVDAAVSDLLQFTSDREPKRESFELGAVIDDVVESLAPQLAAQHVTTNVDVAARTFVWADRQMLRRALLNLVLNALDAMPSGGELDVIVHADQKSVEIEIADSGPGISPEVKARLFDPFYTTKPTGTGLGLAIVQRIAEAHGGMVRVTNCPQGGAALTVCLPRLAAGAPQLTQQRIAA